MKQLTTLEMQLLEGINNSDSAQTFGGVIPKGTEKCPNLTAKQIGALRLGLAKKGLINDSKDWVIAHVQLSPLGMQACRQHNLMGKFTPRYKLFVVEDPKAKTNKFTYYVIDSKTGKRIKKHRASNGNFVACTIDAKFFFIRLDTIGKNEHGKYLKGCDGWRFNNKGEYTQAMANKRKPVEIAYMNEFEANPFIKIKTKKAYTSKSEPRVKREGMQFLTMGRVSGPTQMEIVKGLANLSAKEISEKTGIKINNVRWYLNKIKHSS